MGQTSASLGTLRPGQMGLWVVLRGVIPTSDAQRVDHKKLMWPLEGPYETGPPCLCLPHTHVSVGILEVGGGSGSALCPRLGVALLLACL